MSDWGAGFMLHYDEGLGVTLLELLQQGAADFCFDREAQKLYLPMMFSNELIAFNIFWE